MANNSHLVRLGAGRVGRVGVLFTLGMLAACSQSSGDSGSAAVPSVGVGAGGSGNIEIGGGNPDSTGSGTAGSTALPPEKELDQSFRAPVATGGVLWSTNPISGRVALIDARTLRVRMTNAGFGPTYLAAVPSDAGENAAIVLNVGSHDASFMQALPDQSIAVQTIPTHTGANSWAISDDGHFAIAWTDVTRIDGPTPDPSDGFSELTVIDLSAAPPRSTRLSVGFRPSQIVFDAQKAHAFAVVDEGISVLDLSGDARVSALISLTAGGTAARDVNISPDGHFAIVRVNGQTALEIVDLTASAQPARTLVLESDPTDLDLSPDGKTATAVLGNETPPKVISFPVPDPGDGAKFSSAVLAGELARSVTLAPNDQVALLYANAVPSNDLILLDTTAGHDFRRRTLDLKSAVELVFVSPDSQTGITFQLPPAGSKEKGVFSIVPTSTAPETARAPKIVASDATPRDVAFSAAAVQKALVTTYDPGSAVHGVYILGLANLEQNFVPLASEPLPGATGIVPDVRVGFVAQKHPEGRITFIDLDSNVTQTLTGFEIAARVVQ